MAQNSDYYLYIVLSKTKTVLGVAIRKYLGVEYNHSSIALDESLDKFYSFGRRRIHNFINAGFVVESKNRGFFKVYNDADISVLKFRVTKEEWERVREEISEFEVHDRSYKYNMLGLISCGLGRPFALKNSFFCSQFVADMLDKADVYHFGKDTRLVKPHEFLKIEGATVAYRGKIGNYWVG